jgi:hypothetical protein
MSTEDTFYSLQSEELPVSCVECAWIVMVECVWEINGV